MTSEEFETFWRDQRLPVLTREERSLWWAALVLVVIGSLLGAYAVAATLGLLPAAPWSPVGQAG